MPSVLIIYSSTAGNTELVTDKVAEVLTQKKHKVAAQRAENTKESDLKNYKYIILGSSTYNQGLLQEHMLKFMYYLKSLKGKKCAVIGLGDPKYNIEYVVESAKLLEKGVKEKGGELILEPLRIVKSPVPHLNASVKNWALKLSKLIK